MLVSAIQLLLYTDLFIRLFQTPYFPITFLSSKLQTKFLNIFLRITNMITVVWQIMPGGSEENFAFVLKVKVLFLLGWKQIAQCYGIEDILNIHLYIFKLLPSSRDGLFNGSRDSITPGNSLINKQSKHPLLKKRFSFRSKCETFFPDSFHVSGFPKKMRNFY